MSGYFEGLVGTRLGGYVVQRMIARGGMGVVYEGVQESLDRSVAIKILYPHLSDDPGFRERFQREARALAQLTHPHIVRVIDFGISAQFVYMIMELVRGHSLRDELIQLREQGQTMGIARALEILNAVGLALSFAHERGFVHRDVKPGNILIDESGHVFLTDFGLVKLEDVAGVTATGAVMGTPEYMAPEQFLAISAAGPAADQYALAVVAYEMLAGRVPFQAQTPVSLLHKHLEEEPPSIRTIDSRLPQTVEPVIRRGLAKDPNDRYPTVSTFVRDLDASTTTKAPTVGAVDTLVDPSPVEQPDVKAAAFAPAPAGLGATVAEGPPATPPPPAPVAVATGAAAGGGPPPRPATPAAQSSRPGWLTWVLIGVIPLLLIGVAGATMLGGGDGDDADPTATTAAVVGPTSTASGDTPTETTQSAVEPTATSTFPPTATEAVAPTATNEPAPPTRTRVPVVVTRPIQNIPTPTSFIINIPTTESTDGDYTALVSSDFVEGEDLSIWATSTDQPDFTTQILDGNYVVEILSADPNGYSVFSYPQGANNLGDGAVAARLRVEGDGSAGVMMRRNQTADGVSSMYECHITSNQEYSCWKQVNGEWTEIVPLQRSDAIVPNDFNTVAVGAAGTDFVLQINDADVASWSDDAVQSGDWGVFVERNGGGASLKAFYDAVVIARN